MGTGTGTSTPGGAQVGAALAGAVGEQGGQQQEEISTIFVVGFPEDMLE